MSARRPVVSTLALGFLVSLATAANAQTKMVMAGKLRMYCCDTPPFMVSLQPLSGAPKGYGPGLVEIWNSVSATCLEQDAPPQGWAGRPARGQRQQYDGDPREPDEHLLDHEAGLVQREGYLAAWRLLASRLRGVDVELLPAIGWPRDGNGRLQRAEPGRPQPPQRPHRPQGGPEQVRRDDGPDRWEQDQAQEARDHPWQSAVPALLPVRR